MCGIFAVLRAPSERMPPGVDQIQMLSEQASDAVGSANGIAETGARLLESSKYLEHLDELLMGPPGVKALLAHPELFEVIKGHTAEISAQIATIESELDTGGLGDGSSLEQLNASVVAAKDALWSVVRDRLHTARAVADLAGPAVDSSSAVDAYTSVQLALSAIDRLEVRGRDSAGIAILVTGHDLDETEMQEQIQQRSDQLFRNNSVTFSEGTLTFVYKAAAEIGALGDNVVHLRKGVASDDLLRKVLERPNALATIVSHTRWASVGAVSESNAHPIDSSEVTRTRSPYVIAALNGEVDNYVALRKKWELQVDDEITTDAKVIPTLVSRGIADGATVDESFRSAVQAFEGSVAIAAAVASDPSQLLLAVRGSGQGCYVGFAEDAFLVASEPYGVVEECGSYLRIDGEFTAPNSGEKGQIVVLTRDSAGTVEGLRRYSYSGTPLPVGDKEVVESEVTTRDIDRGEAPHFLLKEISESPESVRRTVRGKITEDKGRLSVVLGPETLPDVVKQAISEGSVKRIYAIGQGTAAVAAKTLAVILDHVAPGGIPVSSLPATELSGFNLNDDMSDSLIVAVSQSGTTTDTNRTIDLVRSRGARVIAVVNRRQSDITERADGVLYTSDGRDVEMSVASTKAFYAQVVALTLLAVALGSLQPSYDRRRAGSLLDSLRRMPDEMNKVLELRPSIAEIARWFAPPKRSWAIVGNGPNYVAACEVRIKLSELCYKSIAHDATEDKKHIDLSAEPMILVMAAGLTGSTAVDVVKEVAIFKAHKASAIVIASEGADFDQAAAQIKVPAVHPLLDFLLSTMVGHLFGYEAALAIDGQALRMRLARSLVDDAIATSPTDDLLMDRLRSDLPSATTDIFRDLYAGALDGHLQTRTAVQLSSLLKVASGWLPLDSLEGELGGAVSPRRMTDELIAVLSAAVDELTRPIDAVKHQAKTVTVGISRTEDSFADSLLIREVTKAGGRRELLGYRALRTLAALDVAVEEVSGFTRYEVRGDVHGNTAQLEVVAKGGIAEGITSRAESDPRLTGTKHRAAFEHLVTVSKGQRDGRTLVIVPEGRDMQVTAITLLHVTFVEHLDPKDAQEMLTVYRNRYSAIVDAVTETEPYFDDSRLKDIPPVDLLNEPVWVLAKKWR